jgi:hypothetical protein
VQNRSVVHAKTTPSYEQNRRRPTAIRSPPDFLCACHRPVFQLQTGMEKRIMLDWWLNLRLCRDWASQAYTRGMSRIDVEPILIGAALLTLGIIRI